MKYPECRIAVYLMCHVLVFAANASAQQNNGANVPIGWNHKPACTEKNPAPNCIPVPHLVSSHSATYSEEARKAKLEGSVILVLTVDEIGNPTDFRVVNSLGMGLDEKAIEAVRKWKFEPAFGKDGKPVAATIAAEVSFHL